MAITASMQPESGRILYAGSDFPHPFQLRFFQRRYGSHCAKPTRVRSGWPGQGLAKRIWSGSKPESSGPVLAERNRPATSFPLSDSVPFFRRRPDNIVQIQPGSNLVLVDCARFGPNGSGPEASQWAGIVRPASGQCFPADPDRIRHVYWGNRNAALWFQSVEGCGQQPLL